MSIRKGIAGVATLALMLLLGCQRGRISKGEEIMFERELAIAHESQARISTQLEGMRKQCEALNRENKELKDLVQHREGTLDADMAELIRKMMRTLRDNVPEGSLSPKELKEYEVLLEVLRSYTDKI
jgi:hypothetical protein